MEIKKFYQQKEFQSFLENDSNFSEQTRFETAIMSRRVDESSFFIDGYCKVCDKPTTFLVDQMYGAQKTAPAWMPNWRERLVCNYCQLNNRQRAILHAVKEAVAIRTNNGLSVSLYAMEQITPLFNWLNQHLKNVTCIGSEYLGDKIEGGMLIDAIVKGMRHENVEKLSFADKTFDIIISNDVLEHVNLPEQAIVEMYRVLKPGGEIFVTVPFHANAVQTECRAKLVNGVVKHFLPPIYHGNPLSEKGSLVFNNFGWDFVEQIKVAGFQEASLCCYWSYFYGYLGAPLFYFYARKPSHSLLQ